MRLRLFLIVSALFIVESLAHAQGTQLTPRQDEILRRVTSVDSSLNRAQYDEFWTGFRSAAESEQFRKSLGFALPAILKYQRTLWLAARESSKQGRPVITPELNKEFDEAERNDRATRHQPPSAEKKRTAMALLEGAAHQTTVNKDGRSMQITPEAIEKVLRGLDGSINRLERLLSGSWQ